MAKAKMKSAVIPKFSSEAKEAAWWDAHRSEIEADIRQRMRQKRTLTLRSLLEGGRPSQPITLRIPREDLETARRLAAQQGLGYQTYIKMLLRGALARDAGDELLEGIHCIPEGSFQQPREFKKTGESSQEVRFQSYNPYEAIYPRTRVVSREALHLIKTLRALGYAVVVEPDDGTKLDYLVEKGFRELVSDPVYAFVIGIPTGLVLNLIANWVSQLKRRPNRDDVNLVVEFDEDGNKVRFNESGRPVSNEKFRSILEALETRKRRFEESRKLVAPDPEYFFPIHLEHTGKVVGWAKGLVFDDREKSIGLGAIRIFDDETLRRIQSGELNGFSHAGIVSGATCAVCGKEYVDCNHIGGVRYTLLPAEISIVKDP